MIAIAPPSSLDYQQALQTLKRGGIVAYPTETFYGLAVDPRNRQAVEALYVLKRRIPGKRLSLLVPDLDVLSSYAGSIPVPYQKLIDLFWPGPLTLVFPARQKIMPSIIGGGDTLAIRISSHPVAAKLCSLWGRPLTATSANISGDAAFVTADEVRNQWPRQIGAILDGGPVPGGKGSTIVHCRDSLCRILRSGVISDREITEALPGMYTPPSQV